MSATYWVIWAIVTTVNAAIWLNARHCARDCRRFLAAMSPEMNLDGPDRSVAEVLRETGLPLGPGTTSWLRADEAVVLARALSAAGLVREEVER